MRRYGETRKKEISYRMRPGAYAILPLKDRLLLTHQTKPFSEFQLPGGGIDPGESPLTALHREVMEETGWRISSPVHFRSYRRFIYMHDYDMWAEKICNIYIARPVRRISAPLEMGHRAEWFSHKDGYKALKNIADKELLNEAINLNIRVR